MNDQPRFLDPGQTLFCIITPPSPDCAARDMGVIILNSGTIHNVGPFGLSVELAKGLAHAGFPVLRLDQTGKGESFAARRESSEMKTLARDLGLAVSALMDNFGVSRIAVLGLCSGADHGLMIADSIPETGALVMLDGWAPKDLRYYIARYLPKLKNPAAAMRAVWRRLRKQTNSASDDDRNAALLSDLVDMPGRQWNQAAMKTHIHNLCTRRIPLLAVYTGDTDDYYAYEGQLRNYLSRANLNPDYVTEVFRPDCKHLYPLIFQRTGMIRDVTEWLTRVTGNNNNNEFR